MNTFLFGFNSLRQHVARGLLGFSLFVAALHFSSISPIASMMLGLGALIVLRGCPLCWTMGLLEKLRAEK